MVKKKCVFWFFFDETCVEGLDTQSAPCKQSRGIVQLAATLCRPSMPTVSFKEEEKSHMEKSLHCDFSFYASFSLRHIRVAGEN